MRVRLLGILAFAICTVFSPFAFAGETKPGFSNESEAGIVIAGGNAKSQSYSFRQLDFYRWEHDALRFDGKYLNTSSNSVLSAKYWLLGARYERSFSERLSAYVGQNIESDIFAGYLQRYNTDIGGKYFIIKEEALYLLIEDGYRRMIENRLTGQLSQNLLRVYAEVNRDWTKTFSTKAGLEYLPNFTISSDFQLNFDASANAAINEIFALKTGFALKYRKIPAPPALENTDTQFTSAIVAKF